MRFRRLILAAIVLSSASTTAAQETGESSLRQLEREMLAHVASRALSIGGFRFGQSEFDLRIPLRGEPEEIIGATLHATEALAVGSARVEPLDTVVARDSTFHRARYAFRLEDRKGTCLIVHLAVTFDSAITRGTRTSERCQPLYMAEVVRRNRRIARLPLSAGRLDDHWSAALAATGTADVYMDSVVITTTALIVRASYPVPATAIVKIDSIDAGLGMGDRSWSVVRRSVPISVDTTLRQGGEWRRKVRRFMIPLDGSFDLAKSWPLFQVHLSVPKTADNPAGFAWTYAHAPKAFFSRLTGFSSGTF